MFWLWTTVCLAVGFTLGIRAKRPRFQRKRDLPPREPGELEAALTHVAYEYVALEKALGVFQEKETRFSLEGNVFVGNVFRPSENYSCSLSFSLLVVL